MVLKVFIKVKKDRQPVLEDGITTYYESDKITLSPVIDGKVNFSLYVKRFDDYVPVKGVIDLGTHGYELYTAEAGIIRRFITKDNL